jgi:dCTP diphosphatase
MSIQDLRDKLRVFADERDWDQYHTPRNLMLAMTGEVGELAELMQWKSDDEVIRLAVSDRNEDYRTKLQHEIADVLSYLIMLSDKLDIDPHSALTEKIIHNSLKYPVSKFKGSAKKYNEEDESTDSTKTVQQDTELQTKETSET